MNVMAALLVLFFFTSAQSVERTSTFANALKQAGLCRTRTLDRNARGTACQEAQRLGNEDRERVLTLAQEALRQNPDNADAYNLLDLMTTASTYAVEVWTDLTRQSPRTAEF